MGEKIPSKGEVRRREAKGKPDDWVPDGPPDLSKSKVVADYLDEAPMIWEGIVKTKYAKKRRDRADQDAGGDQGQGGAERLLRGDTGLPGRVPRECPFCAPGHRGRGLRGDRRLREEARGLRYSGGGLQQAGGVVRIACVEVPRVAPDAHGAKITSRFMGLQGHGHVHLRRVEALRLGSGRH